MGGRSSRNKGMRGEYALRDHLRRCGWEADRVPSSGAAEGFPGDVKATKNGRTVLFEMKFRKDTFKSIYALYDDHVKSKQDDVLSLCIAGSKHLCVDISTGLDAVFIPADFYELAHRHPLYKTHSRTFGKIANLEKLVKEAEILVLKDNNRPLLFVRFR